MLTIDEWHNRYRQQAQWTRGVREHLLENMHVKPNALVLEVGCGTGAILENFPITGQVSLHGIDHKLDALAKGAQAVPKAKMACADALSLPYPQDIFDLTCCHYFLLWVKNPTIALEEMIRVTRPGGTVVALAEPDYGGRIDYPVQLAELGRLQGLSLQRQGADAFIGRRLAGLFIDAGLSHVKTGLLGGEWGAPLDVDAWEAEWSLLEADLVGTISHEELISLRRIDAAAWQKGERILFVPTFYASGVVD